MGREFKHRMGRVLFAWCVVAPTFSASVELLLLPQLEVTDAIMCHNHFLQYV